ncbi:MAG: hypothetical protein ACE5HI_06380 [bacterium]
MKKKLFAVAMVVLLYVLFVFVFSTVDKQGHVSQFLSKVGLSTTPAMASTSVIQAGSTDSDGYLKASLRDPMPPPLRKPPPKPKKDGTA